MQVHAARILAALAGAALALAAARPASAVEAFDGNLQLHGFFEEQIRATSNNFDGSDDFDLAQWYHVLNLELEWDLAPAGWGPFSRATLFSRVEVRYDCVWTRACGLSRNVDTWGDRARHLPKRFSSARRGGFTGAVDNGDRRRYHGIRRSELSLDHRFDPVGSNREPAKLNMVPGFTGLFEQRGADIQLGTEDDPPIYVFERFFDDQGDPRSGSYMFALRRTPGFEGGVGTQIMGPWRPRDDILPIDPLADRANPFNPDDVHPRFTQNALDPGPALTGEGELPYRPAPENQFDAAGVPKSEAKGLYVPNAALQEAIESDRLDSFDQNFRQAELEWNRGASQQDEKELKELYLDLESFQGRLWVRAGKQTIIWGKTELFRTTDQFNPQDLALATLPSLEESRVGLWSLRATWNFWELGPFQDVRLEGAFNFDQFEPADLGRCGEPFTPNIVCQKTVGLFAHGTVGAGLAGERRPPDPWNSSKGLEGGVRLEFRWNRFTFQIMDWYGYNDLPFQEQLFVYSRNVDPASGRPRRGESRGTCLNGTEPACLQGGTDALQNHHANQQLFAVACASTLFFSPDQDPTACGLNILNSSKTSSLLSTVTVAQGLGLLFAGNSLSFSSIYAAGGFFPSAPATARGAVVNAVVPLTGTMDTSSGESAAIPTFDVFLTPEQEALFGCGDLYGTTCQSGGIDLLNAEASALFQSWPGFEGSGRDGIDVVHADSSVARPGTTGFEGGPICTRYEDGELTMIVGCRGPGDEGYDPAVDGVVDASYVHPFAPGQTFRSESAVVSWNFLVALIVLSGVDVEGAERDERIDVFDEEDPRNDTGPEKCSLAQPWLCESVDALLGASGVQRNVVKAGGARGFGRRDFVWHGGSSIVLRYEKRNVLGFSMDFAEDVTKSNWSVEATWIEDLPETNHDSFDNLEETDQYNLTVSVDRPTFVSFLNPGRTLFMNSQWFFQYVSNYDDGFTSNGPFNVLATFTVFTGYFQDRLMPRMTLIYDFNSRSGGMLYEVSYRFSDAFSAIFGVNTFFGRFDRRDAPLVPVGPLQNRAGERAYSSYVENGLSLVRDRDEVFARIRYTF